MGSSHVLVQTRLRFRLTCDYIDTTIIHPTQLFLVDNRLFEFQPGFSTLDVTKVIGLLGIHRAAASGGPSPSFIKDSGEVLRSELKKFGIHLGKLRNPEGLVCIRDPTDLWER